MKLSINYVHLNAAAAYDELIEKNLKTLSAVTRIDEAQVTLAHRADQSPSHVASVRVAVPGPDYVLEVRDHTPEQTLLRAFAMLEIRMRQRHLRRQRQRITSRKHEANFRIGRRSR